jgi:hypothetical protein
MVADLHYSRQGVRSRNLPKDWMVVSRNGEGCAAEYA